MGTIGAAAALDGTLHNNVSDRALVSVEALGLGVSLGVNKQFTDSLDRLFGPATTDGLELLALSVSLGIVPTEGNNLLVLETVFHIVDSFLDHQALNGLSNIVGVLIVGTKVGNLGSSS